MPFYFDMLNQRIIKLLSYAENSILICVAWIDFDIYFETLKSALENGISVRVITTQNKRYDNNTYLNDLISYGMNFEEIKVGKFNYMHNKIAIIDDRTVITGSFNWTHNAEKSFENVLIEDRNKADILILKYEIESISRHNRLTKELRRKKPRCPECQAKATCVLVFDSENNTWLVKTCKNRHITKKQMPNGDDGRSYLDHINDMQNENSETLEWAGLNDPTEYHYLLTLNRIKINEMIENFVWQSSVPITAIALTKCNLDQFDNEEFDVKPIWTDRFEQFDIDYYELIEATED